jgi:purine nucleosidase
MTDPIARRTLLAGTLFGAAALAAPNVALATTDPRPTQASRRVIIDNDFGGDPDGLFMLAHFALCQSLSVRLVVGTHYRDFGEADLVPNKGRVSALKAQELLRFFPRGRRPLVVAGADQLLGAQPPGASAASAAIIREVMSADPAVPLFYAAGGCLTEIAAAWRAVPEIGPRLCLVWIGGAEHPDLASPPPGPLEPEYNFSLDPEAAQIIFNDSTIEIWQIPRNAFRQMLFGLSELQELSRRSPLGRYLQHEILRAHERLSTHLPDFIFQAGETIGLGDSALVSVIALQSAFQPDSASSSYQIRPTPRLERNGSYTPNPTGRPMRLYSDIDAGLTFRDMLAKFSAL